MPIIFGRFFEDLALLWWSEDRAPLEESVGCFEVKYARVLVERGLTRALWRVVQGVFEALRRYYVMTGQVAVGRFAGVLL